MDTRTIIKFILNPRRAVKDKCDEYLGRELQRNFSVPIDEFTIEDTFVVGYPKSGNTWMQTIVSCLVYGIDPEFITDKLAQEIVSDVHARSYYTRFSKRCFFKSHHLPKAEYKNVIYLVRDGRDVITSYYFYLRNLGHKIDLDALIRNHHQVPFGPWHEHVRDWNFNPFGARMMIIRYEDLVREPLQVFRELCDFLQIDRTIESHRRIAQGTAFEKMKMRVKRDDGLAHPQWIGKKGEDFFRKGRIGDYLNYWSPRQVDYFNSYANMQLEEFGYVK